MKTMYVSNNTLTALKKIDLLFFTDKKIRKQIDKNAQC